MLQIALFACLLLQATIPQPPPQPPPGGAPPAPPPGTPGRPAVVPAQPPAPEPEGPKVDYTEGPLRIEVVAMREGRLLYLDDPNRSEAESQFAMQVRVRGDKLLSITRFSNLLLEEVVDETGREMFDPNSLGEQDRTMHPLSLPPERLRETGLLLVVRAKVAARKAQQLRTVRGTVNLVLAEQSEKITIPNPLQYVGTTLVDPRLEELGLRIRVLPATDLKQQPHGQCVVLDYGDKAGNVKEALLFDGMMRQLPAAERRVPTNDDRTVSAFCFESATPMEEVQLVLTVHPKVEELKLPLDAKDVPLP